MKIKYIVSCLEEALTAYLEWGMDDGSVSGTSWLLVISTGCGDTVTCLLGTVRNAPVTPAQIRSNVFVTETKTFPL